MVAQTFKHIVINLVQCAQSISVISNVLNGKFLYKNQKKIDF